MNAAKNNTMYTVEEHPAEYDDNRVCKYVERLLEIVTYRPYYSCSQTLSTHSKIG